MHTMKYLLSGLFALMLTLNGLSQSKIGFEAAVLRNSYEKLNTKGSCFQINYLSKWTITAEFEGGSTAVTNLPSAYKGPELEEKYTMQSISIGRNFIMDPEGKAWLSTSIGMHIGTFNGYKNFAPPPPLDPGITLNDIANGGIFNILLIPILISETIQNIDADHYSYTPYSEKLNGMNAAVMLNIKLGKHGVLGIGSKYVHNHKITGLSFSAKAGLRF